MTFRGMPPAEACHARVQRSYAGMTTARMKLVVVKVKLEDKMEYPAASPDPGEHIVVKVVELAKLKSVLQSACFSGSCLTANDVFCLQDYDKKVCEMLCAQNVCPTYN